MKSLVAKFGLPRIIIVAFFLMLVAFAAYYQMDVVQLLSDCVRRWGMYGVLALAMVPAVQCGIGLNFGISMGIVGGLLGGLFVIEWQIVDKLIPVFCSHTPLHTSADFSCGGVLLAQWAALFAAMLMGVAFAAIIGYFYGLLLNRVKGSEMTVTTYIGFSMIALMNIVWLLLPLRSGELIFPNQGYGVRNTVSLASSFREGMSNTLSFQIGSFTVPTGLLLFLFAMCLLVWLFMRSKTGIAMSASGSNPKFAQASGINVNKMRIIGTVLSTVLAAIGILVYSQGFGFMQLYNGPMMMGFASVASVLIGGASPRRARISHVLLGTFLFQGILALGLPVANQMIPEGNLSEVMRLIISNGIIIYALTQAGGGGKRE